VLLLFTTAIHPVRSSMLAGFLQVKKAVPIPMDLCSLVIGQ
jgi:hypothetical protein